MAERAVSLRRRVRQAKVALLPADPGAGLMTDGWSLPDDPARSLPKTRAHF